MSAIKIPSRTMNLDEFSRITNVSRPVIYREARRDNLPVPVIRIGQRMVLDREAVEELLAKRKDSDAA